MLSLEQRPATTFGILLISLLVIRVGGLWASNAELFYDEAQYWAWGQEPDFGYFSKPPLLAWIIGATTQVCGNSEFCVRLPSPVLHVLVSVFIFLLARKMFDVRTALVAGAVYATMPGVSYSSTLMSTDVPLLALWAAALFALWRHHEAPSLGWGLVFGLAVGAGLNAKYAMAFLPACLVLYAALTPDRRRLLVHPGTLAGFVLAALLILPNLLWVVANNNVTVSHTVEDAALYDRFPNFAGFAEFVLAQGGILGPVPYLWFGIFLLGLGVYLKDIRYRFLFFMCMPVFLVFDVQAFAAKANANWAATAFPALTILVCAFMLEKRAWRSLTATGVIAAIAVAACASYGALAGHVNDGFAGNLLGRLDGWADTAGKIERVALDADMKTVVLPGRALNASMTYYLRDSGLEVLALAGAGPPKDHFQMTRPWKTGDEGPVVVIGRSGRPPGGIELSRIDGKTCFETAIYLYRHAPELCAWYIR